MHVMVASNISRGRLPFAMSFVFWVEGSYSYSKALKEESSVLGGFWSPKHSSVLEPARGTDFECGYRGLLGRPHSRNSANPNFHLRTPKPKAFVQADSLGREALKLWISEILH